MKPMIDSNGNKVTHFASLRDRFNAQYMPVTETGCWLWTGQCSPVGYGQIKDHYKTRHAHRVSYELAYGLIPDGLFICHKCDVRCCVNPKHLYAGTAKDNRRDTIERGQHNTRSGEEHWNNKISDNQAREIFNSPKDDHGFAKRFGVDCRTVGEIRRGVQRTLATGAARNKGQVL